MISEILFWVTLLTIIYTYIGYALVLCIVSLLLMILRKKKRMTENDTYPEVSILIPAYNEIDIIQEKIENIRSLEYPANLIRVIWITDGSTDGSEKYLRENTGHTVLHEQKRLGKSSAINKAMKKVRTPVTILTDANTMLNSKSVKMLTGRLYKKKTGCVSGEKRINYAGSHASVAGEGMYWKYESFIKSIESGLYTAIAGAGELMAFRTELFTEIPYDTINDDFYISVSIIRQGFRIEYCPEAFAVEKPSLNIREEIKRKKRIAAGGLQTLLRNPGLLNIFRYGFYSFQFFSHKVLRWTVLPVFFYLLLIINIFIVIKNGNSVDIYSIVLFLQLIFYIIAALGSLTGSRGSGTSILTIPYYLVIMNIANLAGIFSYMGGRSGALWEKSVRMT